MSYDKVKQAKNISVGTKKVTKTVEQDKAVEVFVSKDADPRLTIKLVALCNQKGVPITYVDSMKLLGKACGIEVGAAVAAVVNE
ncbi:ribosomal L7Ae/L30e/S12e/Gadd45 family protein [Paenibacillus chondroitinus]|uniref:Ribosomal L7Ae/L30e/S12e/Gadd45 family protein n=1 Tax=Paenibacillus chondroitinus TaxID=59842 RepID=A0ABU6DHX4_9BACL|nr:MULTISPECIES: ribosomal L7Ae/L30e/S12e/Gadd45 family protein [Paenibacillus]MCY9659388.1 ribosomal L7Ae/L30e/S12e/Gadd45 family protein [Paenibacillus anseongense]MEB4797146.1 ribosomal L7Ae/L30e/S12e/Gadd45 family protein [Paenibacillus chondroitinus]